MADRSATRSSQDLTVGALEELSSGISADRVLGGVLLNAPKVLFFTGKGGVGKTSTASGVAVGLADLGRRVLLISTDPASNLDEVLGVKLSSTPTQVRGVDGLFALNIDPVRAANDYKERVVAPYRGLLPDASIVSIEEQLSGACTVEIAAFDEFTSLLADESVTSSYDHVIFDTAPTGHTLRLLALPAAWVSFIDKSALGTSCIGPLSGLSNQRDRYSVALDMLSDETKTLLVLVSRPDRLALEEAARASSELENLGIKNQRLVVNGVLYSDDVDDDLARSILDRQEEALSQMSLALQRFPQDQVSLMPFTPVGVSSLRDLLLGAKSTQGDIPVTLPAVLSLKELLAPFATRESGLILTMGKGGVGKTTIAASIAVALAQMGKRVDLTTTDPAAHIESVLGTSDQGDLSTSINISKIDPTEETKRYVDEVTASVSSQLDAQGLALLEEDLRSPCTEEIAVFRAFAKKVASATDRFVIIDTAPTGHTLLLLDAAESYHREVSRSNSEVPAEVSSLIGRLTDPSFSSVFIVTLAESTPIHEAASLQEDLRRAGIEPAAWIVNQSLAIADTTNPTLSARAATESNRLQEVSERFAAKLALVPLVIQTDSKIGSIIDLLEAPIKLNKLQ